jgi:hypothetical protein
MKKIIAIVVVVAALFVWGSRLWPRFAPGENSLRDTTGIEATVLKVEPTERGCRVQCRLVNHRRQFAEQVVFQVALVETNGKILAVNPLASAAAIAPGETRELPVLVPTPKPTVNPAGATITISLVRWRH